MRVVVEAIAGPAVGRKILLGAGQVVQIGRTDWSDVSFPQDGHMSSRHFALQTDQTGCWIKDLGSRNGTFVNGQRIQQAVLKSGDSIVAGKSRFEVRVETDSPRQSPPPSPVLPVATSAPRAPATSQPPAAQPPAGKERRLTDSQCWSRFAKEVVPDAFSRSGLIPKKPPVAASYTIEKCDSGLTLCRGLVGEIGPAMLAAQLSGPVPVYLIVDFHHLGTPPPEELRAPEYLFDWLGPSAAPNISPVVIAQDELPNWHTLIEQGWGNDAVVAMFSKMGRATFLDHLRSACRGRARTEQPVDKILGYCWPSVLAPMLSHCPAQMVQGLLAGIEAVLVELPDLPDTWQVYGLEHIVSYLDAVGLVNRPQA